MSAKGPSVGAPPVTVKVVEAVAEAHGLHAACVAVIVVDPTFTNVAILPVMVATAGFVEAYVQIWPQEFVAGGVNTYVRLSTGTEIAAKVPNVGVPVVTVKVVVTVPKSKDAVAACVAVITDVPTPRKINVDPTTTAMPEFEDVYVHAPVELEVGGVRETKSELQLALIAGQDPNVGGAAFAGAT